MKLINLELLIKNIQKQITFVLIGGIIMGFTFFFSLTVGIISIAVGILCIVLVEKYILVFQKLKS